MIDEALILSKTHAGTGVYSHILRQGHPDEVVMKISGRDCGICRNPLAGDSETLHIWIERLQPELKLSPEKAMHHDLSGTVPDGDCFDYAARYYGLTGQPLLDKLAAELYIKEPPQLKKPAEKPAEHPVVMMPPPKFSFFLHPISNTRPHKTITPEGAYRYITGHYAKQRTEQLRAIADPKQRSAFKCANFDVATFGGTFVTRKAGDLICASHLMVLDFDHITDRIDELKQKLPLDHMFETVLIFRSPSGDGLKWVIGLIPDACKADGTPMTHLDIFRMVSFYLKKTYDLEADPSGKDICRACFMPYDNTAVFNPFYGDI